MKVQILISDLQVPYHDKRAVANVIEFIKWYKPDEVISVGDEMDMQTISKWSRGTALEHEGSIGNDRDEAVRILKALKITRMTRSNHTDRLFNTIALRAPGLSNLPELTLRKFLRLDELGITYHEKPYEIAPNWILMHGDEGSMNQTGGQTALGLAKRSGKSVVCGHTHRMGLIPHAQSWGAGTTKAIWGMEVGNLMDYSKAKYIKGGLFNWQQGFGMLYTEGQSVTPVIIPIDKQGRFTVEGRGWGY